MFTVEYNRMRAVEYAQRWALSYNPAFTNFDELGGDCTSFISQCVYAGSGIMNFTPVYGWYFINLNNRAASWSGVQFFYNFLVNNRGIGPFAEVTDVYGVELGDVIQLGDGNIFYHSLIVTEITDEYENPFDNIRICAHSYPALNKQLSQYYFAEARFLHIKGVNYP